MKVIITGASGILGREVVKWFHNPITPTHSQMPIEDKDKVNQFIEDIKPDLLIHLAATVDMNVCEVNKEETWKINVNGTENLVDACMRFCQKCRFVYMSSPSVFEGEYVKEETAKPKEENHYMNTDRFYGYTKSIGEIIVKRSSLTWIIIRGQFRARAPYKHPKAFIERYGNFIFSDQLAFGIKEIIDSNKTGIFHLGGNKVISMFEVAKRCPNSAHVEPLTIQEFQKENPDARKLPKFAVIKSTRWKEYDIDTPIEEYKNE